MKVNKVSATIRFSKEVHEGWKSVELGAEAALDPEDDWFLTQQGLYASLTGQLRTLWGKNGALEHVPEGSTIAVQPPQEGTHIYLSNNTTVRFTRASSTSLRKMARSGGATKPRMASGAGKGRQDD
jgi:hypothetical protein